MGNCWKKMYYSLPRQEICPYCKKKQFISEQETAFKISTSGCRVCRIKMKYFQEMTYKDISHKTQIPLNTIKVMILRAKKILAELISNENSKS